MTEIKIKYHSDLPRIHRLGQGDWIDLPVDEDVIIEHKGEDAFVSLGISVQLPEGFEAIIAERSSTHHKLGVDLANGIGVIDNSYNGDGDIWKARLVANRDDVFIPRGRRVLQFRIQPTQWSLLPDLEITEVDHLGNDDRGGFGSTGD